MNIIVSNATGSPIYEQIYLQIKTAIVSGELLAGQILPSIRNLAKDLRISVITTKRAYEELEKDGYVYSVPGKGYYVAEGNTELLKEAILREIEEHMHKIYELAPACSLATEDIIEMFKVFGEENYERN